MNLFQMMRVDQFVYIFHCWSKFTAYAPRLEFILTPCVLICKYQRRIKTNVIHIKTDRMYLKSIEKDKYINKSQQVPTI